MKNWVAEGIASDVNDLLTVINSVNYLKSDSPKRVVTSKMTVLRQFLVLFFCRPHKLLTQELGPDSTFEVSIVQQLHANYFIYRFVQFCKKNLFSGESMKKYFQRFL